MITGESSLEDVAARVSAALSRAGITAVLTGGAAVTIYADNRYQSYDIDFVTAAPMKELRAVMADLGFSRGPGRHFLHPDSRFLVEFVAWPVTVGEEVIRRWTTRRLPAGTLQILTPTQCVKDRLAAFFHWRDAQSLEQALLVAAGNRVSLRELARWARAEGQVTGFAEFRRRLAEMRHHQRAD